MLEAQTIAQFSANKPYSLSRDRMGGMKRGVKEGRGKRGECSQRLGVGQNESSLGLRERSRWEDGAIGLVNGMENENAMENEAGQMRDKRRVPGGRPATRPDAGGG